MKSNIIRNLLVLTLVAVSVATATKVSAYSFWNVPHIWTNQIVWGISSEPQLLYFHDSQGIWAYASYTHYNSSFGWLSTDYSSVCWFSSNWLSSWIPWNYWNSNAWISDLRIEDDWQWGLNLYNCSPSRKDWKMFNVPSRAWFTFDDWTFYDRIYFWHNSFIFQNSDTLKTMYIAWDYAYQNNVFYCDSMQENENLYLIQFDKNKAWSTTITKNMCMSIMLWELALTKNVINSFDWNYSYTLSRWWNYFFPRTSGYINSYYYTQNNYDDYSQWIISDNVGWNYSQDLVFVAPEINLGWSGWNTVSWWVDTSQFITYYWDCANRIEMLRSYIQSYEYCNASSPYTAFDLVFNEWGVEWAINYTWTQKQCEIFARKHNAYYSIFSWSWANRCYSSDCDYSLDNLYDYKAPFINLAYSWSVYSVHLDDNNNLSWLPIATQICPSASELENSQSVWDKATNWRKNMVCSFKVWSMLASAWAWNSNYCDDWLPWDESFFEIAKNEMEDMVWSVVESDFFAPILTNYEAWYNRFVKKSCDNSYSFAYWNYILYFAVAIIVLILFGLFF